MTATITPTNVKFSADVEIEIETWMSPETFRGDVTIDGRCITGEHHVTDFEDEYHFTISA